MGGSGHGDLSAWERDARAPRAGSRPGNVGSSRCHPSAARQRPPRPAARRGRSRGAVERCRPLPRAPASGPPCRAARGGSRRANPDGSRRSRAPRAERDCLGRVRRRNRERVRPRDRCGRNPQHGASARLRWRSDCPARRTGGMALRHRLPGRDHDLVGDARPPHGLSHDPDRERSRVLLLRRGVGLWRGSRRGSRPALLRLRGARAQPHRLGP